MLFDRESWPSHIPWAAAAGLLAVSASAWYVIEGLGRPTWPGGSSTVGFTFGLVGGIIILFEFLLWGRKKVRTWRIGRAQTWMRAHIWFGLACLPILIYHSGFRLGGALATVVMLLLVVVVASGVFGAFLQHYLPRRMLIEVPSETIYSQIPAIIEHLRKESERLVVATCGREESGAPTDEDDGNDSGFITIGALRSAGRVGGKVLQTRTVTEAVPDAEALRSFFRKTLEPFLHDDYFHESPLAAPNRAEAIFRELKTKLDVRAHNAVDQLESVCAQRRQLALQKRLYAWLHGWLWMHLPLSVALVVLMFAHVWVAIRYW